MHFNDKRASRLLSVDAPCYHDIQSGIDGLAKTITRAEDDEIYRKVEKAKKHAEEQPVDSCISRGEMDQWRMQARIMEALREERNAMETFLRGNEHTLGRVFAASGLREIKSTEDPTQLSIRDWALVLLYKNRSAGKNTVSFPLSDFYSLNTDNCHL